MKSPLKIFMILSRTLLLTVYFGFLSYSSSFADDIEVYGAGSGAVGAPNVLFVIDISNSMEYGTDGNSVSDWDDSKIMILRSVLADVLSNNTGKINAGVLFFNNDTSGIRWPITDLNMDASLIDPNIPPATTVEQVIKSIVDNSGTWGKTNYLASMVEAGRYFRGEKVWYEDTAWPPDTEPPVWDSVSGRYSGGESFAPNPYTYIPHDAYLPGSTGPNPKTSSCKNYKKYNAALSDGCSGLEVKAGSCVYNPSYTYTPSPYCPGGEVCVDPIPSSQGEGGGCNEWQCPVALVQGPDVVTSAFDRCDYYVGSWVPPNYISPIGSACQGNYIILLSDGIPTRRTGANEAKSMLGYASTAECEDVSLSIFGDSSHTYGNCVSDVVELLNNTDQIAGLSPSNVSTYTVGFGLVGGDAIKGKNFLKKLANKGGGQFFEATNYQTLSDSLTSIINAISGQIDDFSGFSIGVKSNTFSSDNRAFINLFTPRDNRTWNGNIKGYFLDDGLKDTNGNDVLGVDGNFLPNARSFWSNAPDGGVITQGGLSQKLSSGGRTLYTYTGLTDPVNVELNTLGGEHRLETLNTSVTETMLSVPDATARTVLLDWVQTATMTDLLHSKPVVANYATGEVLFTMGNQGFLHAVNANTPKVLNDYSGGEELFAFIPQELLPNLQDIKSNLSTGAHIYGLDGSLVLRHDDSDGDHVIDSGEKAVLYFGMRRGGNHYYALDISDKADPKLLWKLSGGSGDFTDMGQTWSRMLLTTVRSSGSAKKALIFGGGYDTAEDSKTSRSSGIGNRIYVVDADTGSLLWSVGDNAPHFDEDDMEYSIASDITAIDLNGNGYADHLYVGDMGGKIWRIIFEEAVGGDGKPTINFNSNVSVDEIGDFGSSGNLRFYYPPVVALIREKGKEHLAITIGSGNRAHPLDTTVQDWVLMIRDPVDNPLSSSLDFSDLYDVTNNLVMEGGDTQAERAALALAKGWKMKLRAAEKSLSELLVFDNKLRFTTYQPVASTSTSCGSSSVATARYYVMNLDDATPASDNNALDESTLTKDDRSSEISGHGISSSPSLVFPPDGGNVDVYVGVENVGSVSQTVKRIYWKQVH